MRKSSLINDIKKFYERTELWEMQKKIKTHLR
jgi:hypothetical protein